MLPSMFPKEATQTITLYVRYINPASSGNAINIRCVLENCIFQADSSKITENTGQVIRSACKVLIPYLSMYTGRKYVTPETWNKIIITVSPTTEGFPNYWTLDPTLSTALSIIIPGESTHEFTWATPAQLNLQETAFLNANPDARRMTTLDANVPQIGEDVIREQDPKTYNRMKNLWHIEARGAR